jgi:hypothetical protein
MKEGLAKGNLNKPEQIIITDRISERKKQMPNIFVL